MLWQEYTSQEDYSEIEDPLAVPNGRVYCLKDASQVTSVHDPPRWRESKINEEEV